jgi:hypothetical protein
MERENLAGDGKGKTQAAPTARPTVPRCAGEGRTAAEEEDRGPRFPEQGEMSKTQPHDHGGALRQGARAELVGARSIIDAALRLARSSFCGARRARGAAAFKVFRRITSPASKSAPCPVMAARSRAPM